MKYVCVIFLVLLPAIYAEDALLLHTTRVLVQCTGERAFTVSLPHGTVRSFSWLENETCADAVFDAPLYVPFNETENCPKAARQVDEWRNVSEGLVSMLATCQKAVEANNQTAAWTTELQACKNESFDWQKRYGLEVDARAGCQNRFLSYVDQTKTLNESEILCQSQLETQRQVAEANTKCPDKLEAAQSTASTRGWLAWLLVLATFGLTTLLWYFRWKHVPAPGTPDDRRMGFLDTVPPTVDLKKLAEQQQSRVPGMKR